MKNSAARGLSALRWPSLLPSSSRSISVPQVTLYSRIRLPSLCLCSVVTRRSCRGAAAGVGAGLAAGVASAIGVFLGRGGARTVDLTMTPTSRDFHAVAGIDFTSGPTRRKPITVALGEAAPGGVRLVRVESHESF